MVIDGKFVDQKKPSRLFANDGELFSPINRVHYRRILADTRLRCPEPIARAFTDLNRGRPN
jgi:hypothetical protein